MTQLLVLGALDMRPMSGYDIQMLLKENEAERWSGVQVGSIYHALKKLEKDKYIEIDKIEHNGFRQKAVYKITESGRIHLEELIFESIQSAPVPYPIPLYSGLSFIEKLTDDQARAALEDQLHMLEEELGLLESGLKIKKEYLADKVSPMIELVSENMMNTVKQQIQFIQDILALAE